MSHHASQYSDILLKLSQNGRTKTHTSSTVTRLRCQYGTRVWISVWGSGVWKHNIKNVNSVTKYSILSAMPSSLGRNYQHFRGTCCLHLQERIVNSSCSLLKYMTSPPENSNLQSHQRENVTPYTFTKYWDLGQLLYYAGLPAGRVT